MCITEMKICCITGHRKILLNLLKIVHESLQAKILKAVSESYEVFISGFAEGVDLLFASAVAEMKTKHPIRLYAAIPYRKRLYAQNAELQRLIKCADAIEICSESYFQGCFHKRNRFMVDHSDRLIADYDGRNSGGTYATIQYARQTRVEIEYIRI